MILTGTRVLLTGAGGFIGSHLDRGLRALGAEVASSRSRPSRRADLARAGESDRLVRDVRPDVVVHAAAMSRAGDCEAEPELAERVNRNGTLELAEAAASCGAYFLHFSTDQVFDGSSGPFHEDASLSPIHVYGRTKAEADRALLEAPGRHAVLRPTLVFGASVDGRSSASDMVRAAHDESRPLRLFDDEYRSPVAVSFVVRIAVALVERRLEGVFHVAGADHLSRWAFGLRVCQAFGLDPSFIEPVSLDTWNGPARPRDLALRCGRLESELGIPLPGVNDALKEDASFGA